MALDAKYSAKMEALLYVAFFTSSICLILILFIGIISIKQFTSLKHLQSIFKCLFHTSWLLSSIGLILISMSMISHISFLHTHKLTYFLGMYRWGYACLYVVALVLLLVLLLRLRFSFKHSIYEISCATKCILTILYTLTCLTFLFSYTYYMVLWNDISFIYYSRVGMNIISSLPGYIITFIVAIILFGSKLMKLTNTRATSIYAPSNDTDEEISVPELNPQQIKMIETTTRYVSLLSLGIFSTFCGAIASFFVHYYSVPYYETFMVAYIISSVDCLINIICLYLQYPFATNYYHRYCKCLHLCFRYILTRQATKALLRRYRNSMEQAQNDETVQLRVMQ
eukprot:172750_1